MEQLKRWANCVCICAFCLPTSPSTNKFQGVGKLKPRFSQSCLQPKRWIATLQHQCERLASLMQVSNLPSTDLVGLVLIADEHHSTLKLVQRMTNNFYVGVSDSLLHTWTMLWNSSNENDDIHAMTCKTIGNLGKPHGIILSVATSIWLPVSPQCVLVFVWWEST